MVLRQFESLEDEIDPLFEAEENAAEQNMGFFLYIIKDVLIHVGFFPETSPHRELQTALYKFEVLTAKSQEFTKVLAQLEQ